ncbi:hypothetical protein I352_06008 [Cryptococcus deuterogattii MMRL2647]|nr:hypothetical protein I352_06008 [Cryptococcus deuterogattii MMRL2647]
MGCIEGMEDDHDGTFGLLQDGHFFETAELSSKEVSDVLQEFVLHSIRRGKIVREWGKEVSLAFSRAPSLPAISDALATPLLSTLLPFTRLPANSYFPTPEPPLPTSLLPNSLLSALTRNQLIDTLVRLGKDDRLISKRLHYGQELVLELCLEYIGRRWRSSEAVAENVVETNNGRIRSQVRPGFVTSFQLVTRLNSSDRSIYLHPDSRPYQSITWWIERRLPAGMAYPLILEECKTMKQGE